MDVNEHEVVGIIGPNGHGKSTLLKVACKLLTPMSGSIVYNGIDVTEARPYELVEKGLVYISESGNIFYEMTVIENLKLGAYKSWGKRDESIKQVFELFPKLKTLATRKASTLSGGERRMLAVGRGLMTTTKLMLIDEPSLGLAPLLVQQVYEKIRELHKRGLTLVISEQNIDFLSSIADRLDLVEKGRIVREGRTQEVLEDDHVKSAYLGIH